MTLRTFDKSLGASLALDPRKEVFDPIVPELKQESEYNHLLIIVSLLPHKQEIYLTYITAIGDETFPEARRILRFLYNGHQIGHLTVHGLHLHRINRR